MGKSLTMRTVTSRDGLSSMFAINTNLHLSMPRIFALDKGLCKEGMQLSDTRTVGRKDFEAFGHRIGLSERLIKREMDFFAAEHPLAKELIDHSSLSDSLIQI